MRLKDKIWDKKIHWFTLKFRFIFLVISIIFTILKILEVTIWSRSFIITFVFIVFELIFYGMFFIPIIAKLPFWLEWEPDVIINLPC